MCSVSLRKCAEEEKAVFNICTSKRDPQMFMHSEYAKLAEIQEYCALWNSQYFSTGLILDIL